MAAPPTVHQDEFHAILLPRLVLVADGIVSGRPGMPAERVRQRVLAAVEAGVAWVHLRDHPSSGDALMKTAPPFVERLRTAQPSLQVTVNGRLDLAHTLGAGLHTGAQGPPLDEARRVLGPFLPIGYSAHSAAEACRAAADGADYVFLGPVFSTDTHPGRAPLGTAALRAACLREPSVPLYAIGGVTAENAPEVRAAGAYGVAVLSGLLDEPDLVPVVAAYLQAIMPPSA